VSTTITNYDGGIVTTPKEHVCPESIEELQSILRQPDRYPSPVRAIAESEPVREEGARRLGVRRPVEKAGGLAPDGRPRPANGQ
jgi:hypothetical protein